MSLQVAFADKVLLNKARTFFFEGTKKVWSAQVVVKIHWGFPKKCGFLKVAKEFQGIGWMICTYLDIQSYPYLLGFG